MKNTITILITLITFNVFSQKFINGDLEGIPTNVTSVLPVNWQSVPYGDISCKSTDTTGITSTPDLTGMLPGTFSGRPFSGQTFVSGLNANNPSIGVYQEGIMQTVYNLSINKTYIITFRQSVIYQDNALDNSGSWVVYVDSTLIGITQPSYGRSWELRTVTFTAKRNSHLIKFLPLDDDSNINISSIDTNGAIRMGIDSINLFKSPIKSFDKSNHVNIFPKDKEQVKDKEQDKDTVTSINFDNKNDNIDTLMVEYFTIIGQKISIKDIDNQPYIEVISMKSNDIFFKKSNRIFITKL